MSLFRRKPKPPKPAFDPEELRRAARRLTGWTVTGDGLDLDGLLFNAADELDRLQPLVVVRRLSHAETVLRRIEALEDVIGADDLMPHELARGYFEEAGRP